MVSQRTRRVRRDPNPPELTHSELSYRPSTLLLCSLLVAVGLGVVAEFINGPLIVIFSATTYAPTIHFAIQGIVRNILKSKWSEADTIKSSFRAIALAVIWCLTIGVHVFVWWSRQRDETGDIFLVSIVPGIQSAVFVILIALRTTLDARVIKSADAGYLCGGEYNDTLDPRVISPSTPLLGESPSRPDIPNQVGVSARQPFYEIPNILLVTSISLAVWTAVSELIITKKDRESSEIVHIFLMLAYIPTALFHLYLMLHGGPKTFTDAVMIGGLSLDLVPLWLGSHFIEARYIHFCDQAVWHAALVASVFENLLVGYIALRCGASVIAEWRLIRNLNIEASDLSEISETSLASEYRNPTRRSPIPEVSPTTPPLFYQPSIVTLTVYSGLAITCAVIESYADFAYGILMSLLVYIPTVFSSIASGLRRQDGLDCGLGDGCRMAGQEPEQFIHIGLLWILTQAFYVFLLPPMENRGTVMEPWLRWTAVAVGVYVTARYVWSWYTVPVESEETGGEQRDYLPTNRGDEDPLDRPLWSRYQGSSLRNWM